MSSYLEIPRHVTFWISPSAKVLALHIQGHLLALANILDLYIFLLDLFRWSGAG